MKRGEWNESICGEKIERRGDRQKRDRQKREREKKWGNVVWVVLIV